MSKNSIITKVCAAALAGFLLSTSALAADFKIKISHSSPASGDRLEKSLAIFKKNVEERTDGNVSISTFPASQLGGEREQMEGVQFGSIEMAVLVGPISNIYPDIMVFDLPYLFKNRDVAYKVMDGEFGQKILNGLLERTGIRAIAWGENGFRHFTNNVRPLETPEDLKGLKIRTMENPAHIAMVNSFGAIATPMAFNELYSALQQGVIDGQENPVSLIESMRFYEVQKHLTLDGHVYSPFTFIVNNGFFESLPAEYQRIIQEEAKLWSTNERKLNAEQENAGVERLKQAGMEVVSLSDEVKGQFRESTTPVYNTYREKLGDDLIDELMNAVSEAESNL
ncbi:TRAP transporter substrate-binding protein [Marinobacterium lacunae]|nr:DctP family TRAP transporter solute-binding subunit [Marinobacterium lacunae]